jgi:NAD-dependent deacetylase
MRPHIVWFGEMPFELPRIYGALERCGLFLAIGTSGLVYPAAGFVAAAERAWTVELNLEPSEVAGAFREHRAGAATETVPDLVGAILSQA